MAMKGHGTTWWTWGEVRDYLGHQGDENATYVWLNRHGIEPLRVYDANEVVYERTTRRPWGSVTRRP